MSVQRAKEHLTSNSTDFSDSSHVNVSSDATPLRGLNPTTPPFRPPEPPSTICNAGSNTAILLQLVKAIVINLNQPTRKNTVHILMDGGSQCSYITSKACRKLGLKSLGTKSMSILTFGSRNECLTDCNVVKLGIRLKDGTHTELKLL